jgi:hypothetical protein
MDTNQNDDKLLQRYYDSKHMGWASPGWTFLHSIADSFPTNPSTEDQEAVKMLFRFSLPKLLPCSLCNEHFSQEYLSNVDASSGEKLSKWLYTVHNHVNQRTGKPILEMAECRREQEFLRSVKWESVIKDLKLHCKMAGSTPLANDNQCTSVEPFENFRRFTDFDQPMVASTVKSGQDFCLKKEKILVLTIIILLAMLLVTIYYFNNIISSMKILDNKCRRQNGYQNARTSPEN